MHIGWCAETPTQILNICATVMPILIFLTSIELACQILKLDFKRNLTFAIINLFISSLCLSPVLCLLVFGRFISSYPIIAENFTLSYFFAKLPLIYDRVPAYLLACLLIILVIYCGSLLLGTYLTSRLLSFNFRNSLLFMYTTMLLTFTLLLLSLMLTRGSLVF